MKLIPMFSSNLSKPEAYLEGPWKEMTVTYYPMTIFVEIAVKTIGFTDNTRVPKP